MSVYAFVETKDGRPKHASLEALCYARALSETQGHSKVCAIIIGPIKEPAALGAYGATEGVCVGSTPLQTIQLQARALASALPEAAHFTLILARSLVGEQIAARVAILQQAALATGVLALPEEQETGTYLSRSIYTGKAFETLHMKSKRRIFCVQKNAVPFHEDSHAAAPKMSEKPFTADKTTTPTRLGEQKSSQRIPLPEADIVVSGGRGMKGPENWHLIEELAHTLGAATACSKPVADMEWRPHHEHVGQTGLKIAPKLYIAIGISGAVQHLAGISNSKVIVVINSDPEAPFFQVADYGIVGDALKILPQLTHSIKKLCP